ncbi:AraC family transcriptional regulator [Leptospira yasudae]|uniref:AraC family transcriptional regulator n=1 Tax=Leptospira yasudae TaxID=2202201 RepID=A0A6N4R2T1_9LEPT|nr:helix-turn-helix domain-containing protein [Leptospira yasudae]TGL76512.1 AraC family transcriptional regulator [Leptospira yasudae]TGL83435.1 AraC family transcriptional regulator [Leptospira yasudae]TGL89417.1 AraC family transcriptional regulator [Leptospira yasudae]
MEVEAIQSLFEVLKEFVLLDKKISPFSVCIQAVAILWSLSVGVSDLFRYKKIRMNSVRAAKTLSVFFMLILYNIATYYMISPALYHPGFGHKLFFGIYLAISFYNVASSLIYFLYIQDLLEKPERYSNLLLIVFPLSLVFTFSSENLILPIYVTNALIAITFLSISCAATISVYYKKIPRIYLNYLIVCTALAFAYCLRIYGIEVRSPDILVNAFMIGVYGILYLFFLQFYFPGFGWKSSRFHNGEPDQDILDFEEECDGCDLETKNPQKRNLLEGVNLQTIENRIEKFVKEKVFVDEDIRLPDFAAYLGLTVHQASYYLNQYKKLNFPEFINYHRFEEAKDMILRKTNLNLLEIGLACGFNSPSSFHRASVKFAGIPPRDLKKELLRTNPSPHEFRVNSFS